MIPIYTTETIPIAGSAPIQHAWPVWAEADHLGKALDELARSAASRGAHAVVALKVTTISRDRTADIYVLLGTAAVLGH